MDKDPSVIRYAVIGAGAAVFKLHLPGLRQDGAELVGVAEVDPTQRDRLSMELECPVFEDYRALLREAPSGVVVVLTPHPLHARMTLDALEQGCHVLVEKPMAVQVAEADAMIAAAARAGRLLAVNFQQRVRPEVRAAAQLIREGGLGKVQFVEMVESWMRTAAYYRMSPWRGTWRGEGAGVLLNQAPHNFDLLCYLLGMPARVSGWTRTALHRIETEDTVHAMLEWPDGAVGMVHISTAEAGASQRMEIVGTAGRLRIGKGTLSLGRFTVDVRDHVANSPNAFSEPGMVEAAVALDPDPGGHLAIYRNLEAAIRGEETLIASGEDGRMSLELANGIALASHRRAEVTFPIDREAYAGLLAELTERAALG